VAKVEIPFLDSYVDNRGRLRTYYRRDGRRIALPAVADPGFMAAYEEAAAQFIGTPTIQSRAPAAGTFNALCVSYYHSPAFLGLQEGTRRTYRQIIDRWRTEHGHKRVSHLRRSDILTHMSARAEASGPHAANNLLAKLKILTRFGVENEWRRDDPAATVRNMRAKSEGFTAWKEEDIAAFIERWPKGTRQYLALVLLLYTGQRRSDVVKLGRQHVTGKTIRVVQQKTGARLVIPIHETLRAVIDDTPKGNMTFLMTEYGKPFSGAGFGNLFREWCDAAGLKGLSAHGLRKAAARRLADAGCSTLQIAAVTGHKTLSELQVYTAAADQERLARDAMGRIK
jgi:integrase